MRQADSVESMCLHHPVSHRPPIEHRLLVPFDRLTPRFRRPLPAQLLPFGVGALRGDPLAILLSGRTESRDLRFIPPWRRIFSERDNLNTITARLRRDYRGGLRPLRGVGAIHLDQHPPIRPEELQANINSSLIHHDPQILACRQRNLKGMCFAARQLSLDGSALFKRGVALLRGGKLSPMSNEWDG